ncbi:MAG: chaperone NapD [Candidatus Nitricoxidivorans perseverans]|uniref:Chaperone NapD n=1 Tax=Candidatus Nitricoxidivorans perseverans TaxID=2975601 RepID=A0AA49FJ93_9PROT|nr:MAG: chaperone NapD [Candidatus Nitricoxidivorans perseverans]
MNISSAIIHARPGAAGAVQSRLAGINGVDIHAVSEEGRIIVTIETDDDRGTADTFEFISQVDGVLSASMVYHQTESDPDKEV